MAVPQRLTMVTLGVADVARSTQFYESLGWRRSSVSQDTITFFKMQGSVLGLYGRRALADDAQVPSAGTGFRAVTIALNCDGPAEVDEVFAAWVAAGAVPVKQPEPVEWVAIRRTSPILTVTCGRSPTIPIHPTMQPG